MVKNIELRMTNIYVAHPSDHPDYKSSQFIFIENLTVVGTIEADCYVCAWRDGHPKWPAAAMAFMGRTVEGVDPCVWWNIKGSYV